jgi:hypothetical protein
MNPLELSRVTADLALLKKTLNDTGQTMTYMQVARLLGLDDSPNDAALPKEAHSKLALAAQQLYELEYRCATYDASTWDVITRPTGSPWTWGGGNWEWSKRLPPGQAHKKRRSADPC